MSKLAIKISNLTKIYAPDLKAVNNLSLEIKDGEIMALLGPNGAGKSTVIRILSTLCGFDEGQAFIDGIDIDVYPEKVRQTIGVVAQQTGVDYFMTGRENMMLQGRMYRMKKSDILARIDELATYFELNKSIDKMVSTYSGGMRRKLDIATALIHRPRILFLDEPTLGLDIHNRKILWRHIEELNQKFGLTILLTTHYLEEADSLSHRVAIINDGAIQIIGTADELKNTIHGDSIKLSFDTDGDTEKAYAEKIKQFDFVSHTMWEGSNLYIYVDDGATRVLQIMEEAGHHKVEIKTLSLARPTLDDVFLKYTGTSMLDKKDDEGGEEWWHQWAGKGGGNNSNWKKWAGDETEEEGWEGNDWVSSDGSQKKEWGDDPEWKGNDWVNSDGTQNETKLDDSQPDTIKTDADGENKKPDDWDGNDWVDDKGEQKGDWGDDPDWKGNEWVNSDGKPKSEWEGSKPPADDSKNQKT